MRIVYRSFLIRLLGNKHFPVIILSTSNAFTVYVTNIGDNTPTVILVI